MIISIQTKSDTYGYKQYIVVYVKGNWQRSIIYDIVDSNGQLLCSCVKIWFGPKP